MAQTPASSGFSPLKSLVTYTSQTSGLEKTLRLIQATSQVVGVTTASKTLAKQCLTARDQLALSVSFPSILQPSVPNIRADLVGFNHGRAGVDRIHTARRYFRLLDFYGCFERVHFLINTPSSTGTILSVMELAQYTFLGLYLLLEDLTIVRDIVPSHPSSKMSILLTIGHSCMTWASPGLTGTIRS